MPLSKRAGRRGSVEAIVNYAQIRRCGTYLGWWGARSLQTSCDPVLMITVRVFLVFFCGWGGGGTGVRVGWVYLLR